ncbi:hypothetical protein [Iodobacter fluviatilis]|uniref:Uncharacterized protein n=1 Tax=Iodobacter fluviatilis TaxID=537 RepID=A0A7G3GF98_9NEIS|nr:hypothetical protein [Iodobacter fluviatilis]QBC45854.1 hypothetical protein C1H71_20135 [Iodobacter fluviatilis]
MVGLLVIMKRWRQIGDILSGEKSGVKSQIEELDRMIADVQAMPKTPTTESLMESLQANKDFLIELNSAYYANNSLRTKYYLDNKEIISSIENISLDKPMSFSGYCLKKGNFELVTPIKTLTPEQTNTLLAYLLNCEYRSHYDKDLQCISQTIKGEALLTGWMPKSVFKDFLDLAKNDCSIEIELQGIITSLAEMFYSWDENSITDVFFDGYRKAT